MTMSRDQCYAAIERRDRRFDGRFFTAVKTTGIYCRPICPARTPKAANVEFFTFPAAAEAAGYRPCLRCRPETAPGTPAWLGTSAIVGRALRLIDQGALDDGDVERLAARVGVTGRHLRRLFQTHVRTTPQAVAQARRVHFALRLLRDTRLPITRIAFDAGFASIRQFNHSIRQTCQKPPRTIRREHPDEPPSDNLRLRLPYRPPLDWPALLNFLRPRAIPGVEVVGDTTYVRTIAIGPTSADRSPLGSEPTQANQPYLRHSGESRNLPSIPQLQIEEIPAFAGMTGQDDKIRHRKILACREEIERLPHGVLRVEHDATAHALVLEVPAAANLLIVVRRVRRLFDLDADPLAIAEHLSASPTLKPLVERRPGLRVPGAWDAFELCVRAILGQQVSVRGATTLAGRLVQRWGQAMANPDVVTHLFPSAACIAGADVSVIGLPKQRAATIQGLAQQFAAGSLELDTPRDLESVITTLCALPGIGPWTANYIAMRACGEPDAFPAGDLGIRHALGDAKLSERQVTELAEVWRPWRAYAALHLWTSLSKEE